MISRFFFLKPLKYAPIFNFQEQQNQARGSGAWWDRMKSLATTSTSMRSTAENIPQLKQDILALEELSRQLFLEIHDLQNMRERLEWSKTWQGKYFNFLDNLTTSVRLRLEPDLLFGLKLSDCLSAVFFPIS